VGGSVSLAAAATDNVGVVGVQFKLDGQNLGDELDTAPYSGTWNTSGVSNGTHTLTALARDLAGNQTTSNPVTVSVSNQVGDSQAPTTPSNLQATVLSSSQISLSWSASTDNVGVAGYRVYRNGTLIASPSLTSYSNTGLLASTLYAYTVSAFDASGNESSQSVSVSVSTQAAPDTTAPVISSVSSVKTSTSATISWTTNEPADTQVEYGLTTSYGSLTSLNQTLSTSHSASLTSLTPNTTYHYRVKSKDLAGNRATGSDLTVTTDQSTQVDTTPPVISNVSIRSVSSTNATVTWTTNEPATSRVDYGLSSSFGNQLFDSTLSTTHSITIEGLTRKTTYSLRVASGDSSGNTSTSQSQTFTTTGKLSKPPKILSLSAREGSVILSWTNPTYEYASKIVITKKTTPGFSQQPEAAYIVATLPLGTTSWSDQNVRSGTPYYYSVFLLDTDGVSSDPSAIAFTPKGKEVIRTTPTTPTLPTTPGTSLYRTGTLTPTVPQRKLSAPLPSYRASATMTRSLSLGSMGEDVRTLQKSLNAKGFAIAQSGAGSSGLETTTFGPATRRALERFQCARLNICSGTPSTTGYGFAGARTRAELLK
jgi:chitodextrinase